jgi:hypothetical protein
MYLIIFLLFLFILLLYKFPFIGFFIIVGIFSYSYLVSKFHSSANLINYLFIVLKNWQKTGVLDLDLNNKSLDEIVSNKLETLNPTEEEIFTNTKKYEEELNDNIYKDNISKLFKMFPEIEILQTWLLDNDKYYINYKYEILQIWKKILNKFVEIISNPTSYASNNFTDIINLQTQLLEILEFTNNMSFTTQTNSTLNEIINNLIDKNREINSKLVKWIKTNITNINIRSGCVLNDFEADDWVAPSNLMEYKS